MSRERRPSTKRTERDPLLQLAERLIEQRGERRVARTITAYCLSLTQRMQDIYAQLQRPLTGEDLYTTILRRARLAWNDASEEEQALYNTVVRYFNETAEEQHYGSKPGGGKG